MKRSLLFLGLAILVGSFSSCKKYKNKEVYANVPVYQDYDSFRNSFEFQEGIPMRNAGNIFVHDHFLLINDIDKGIHVYENSDVFSPYTIGFMNIPGNTQMAVEGNILYADSFMDLVVVDITNLYEPVLIKRLNDVFSYSLPMINEGYPVADIDMSQGVVVDWNIEKTKEVSGFMAKFNVKDCPECETTEVQTKNAVSSARVNLAGSMSQFAIVGDYLYALDVMDIKSFNITDPTCPEFGGRARTWAEPETLFPDRDGNFLYVGTTTGMMIYETGSDPDFPNHLSTVEHVETCDPVVVDGDYAYVTLRSGSDCGGTINEYQVIDISDKNWPSVEATFDMYDPHGLAVENDLLFICDGDAGLKIYDITDPETSGNFEQYEFEDIKSRDIILNNGLAIMIAEDGVYQYDYSDPSNIYMLSILYF